MEPGTSRSVAHFWQWIRATHSAASDRRCGASSAPQGQVSRLQRERKSGLWNRRHILLAVQKQTPRRGQSVSKRAASLG